MLPHRVGTAVTPWEWKRLKGCVFSPSTGRAEGREKTQPFKRIRSRLFTHTLVCKLAMQTELALRLYQPWASPSRMKTMLAQDLAESYILSQSVGILFKQLRRPPAKERTSEAAVAGNPRKELNTTYNGVRPAS